MEQNAKHVHLGFTPKQVLAGTHMCLVFTDEQDRKNSLLKFLLSGLQTGERAACFSSKVTEDELRAYFSENNISYDERKQNNAIVLAGTSEVYFSDGCFDPDRMLNNLIHFYNDSKQLGYSASRVIGEMIPEVEHIRGGDRLIEYESRVSLLLKETPVTCVCQYDANVFNGATIMEVLKVHPQMIVNGSVINNPFYIEPEEYLRRN